MMTTSTEVLRGGGRYGIIAVMGMELGAERRALVVEDDRDIQELLERILTTQGFTVTTVDNGPDGVEAVRTGSPTWSLSTSGSPDSTASRYAVGSDR